MKNFKLWVHQNAFSENELVINPKEFPDVGIGDILEIYHPEEEHSHLLLQVKSFKDDLSQQSSKEIVSVEQGVAALFQLRAYKPVKVRKVQSADVALDLVELVFKDQYISRSDMWRMKNSLVSSCLHIQQKVELSGIRAQVQDLWSRGEKVACGAITPDTRVAFRSATAMVYLFIQMSSEMWDFDTCGDLYFEKAVGGFLTDLFTKWKEKGVNNEVTVVLFSRTFFKARSRDQFPEWMRETVKVDYLGRFYQDFYRTIVQHERRDEWHGLLQTLKAHFTVYLKEVLCHTKQTGLLPPASNSTAAEGNFLETLNMTLNVFDKHFVDRNFERTGQLVVLLTPGAGVFDVDREMCKITRQRMIDYGIGSDLVCLAEQPLHAVPLFRFHNKTKDVSLVSGDYNIPHWLNYSFYTKEEGHSNDDSRFKPRIKLAEKMYHLHAKNKLPSLVKGRTGQMSRFALLRHISSDSSVIRPDDFDYQCEEYDEGVFCIPNGKSPKPRTPASMRPSGVVQRTRLPASIGHIGCMTAPKNGSPQSKFSRSDLSDNIRRHSSPGGKHGSFHSDDGEALGIPWRDTAANPVSKIQREATTLSHSLEGGGGGGGPFARHRKSSDQNQNQASVSPQGIVVGSAGAVTEAITAATAFQFGRPRSSHTQSRALVNPFGTSNLVVKLTSNRRRWTHTFPQGPYGGAMQVHHRNQLVPSYYLPPNYYYPHHTPHPSITSPSSISNAPLRSQRNSTTIVGAGGSPSSPHHQFYLWGPPAGRARTPPLGLGGEDRSAPLTPGLPRSASENRLRPSASGSSLFSQAESCPSTDTVLQMPSSMGNGEHGVDWKSLTATACLPITTDFYPDRLALEHDFVEFNYELLAEEDITGPFMTVDAIFQELISQRLLQGFQLVVLPSPILSAVSRSLRQPPLVTNPEKGEYVLSIGRIFHKLCLHTEKKTISVTMYRPRHPSLCDPIQYTYQLWSVQNEGYTQIQTTFRHEVIERYNWNYLDNYISSHDSDFTLVDSLKFWRSRFMLIPNTPLLVKRFAEETGSSPLDVSASCDHDPDFARFQTEAFLRFVEILNGIRRQTSTSRGPKASGRHTPIAEASHPGSRGSPGPESRQRHASSGGGGGGGGGGSPAPHPHPPPPPPPSIGAPTAGVLEEPLSLCTPLPAIATAMADPSKGLRFLPCGQKGLPANCFVASDAMAWVQRSFTGDVTDVEALELLKQMHENKLVQHASGNRHIAFIPGFYVYCLVLPENVPAMTDTSQTTHTWCDYVPLLDPSPDLTSHWFEVAVMEELLCRQKSLDAGPGSLASSLTQEGFRPISPWSMQELSSSQGFGLGSMSSAASSRGFKVPDTKNVMLEIDCNKTDRVKWCHVTYDGRYSVDKAFDLRVEWLVCTPSLLNDLLQGWSRKANTYGFHLVPAPADPFHQHPDFANPLRCPLFIPLTLSALRVVDDGEGAKASPGNEENTSSDVLQPGDKRIDTFQDHIMQKYGFILIRDKTRSAFDGFGFHSGRRGHQMEYIHKSGVCFVTPINAADTPAIAPSNPVARTPGQRSQVEVIKAPPPAARRKSRGNIPITVGRDGQFEILDTREELESESPDAGTGKPPKLRSGSIREARGDGGEGTPGGGGQPPTNVGFLWSMNHMLTKRWRCSACGDEKVYDALMRDLIDISRNVGGRLTDLWVEQKTSFTP